MDIIADTNIFLSVALNENERDRIVDLTKSASVIAPEILPYEIGNALSAMIKRKKLDKSQALSAYKTITKIPVRLVSVDIPSALKIAIEHNIYAYDAYFLQCSKTYSLPLFSLDKRMNEVAIEMGIKVLE